MFVQITVKDFFQHTTINFTESQAKHQHDTDHLTTSQLLSDGCLDNDPMISMNNRDLNSPVMFMQTGDLLDTGLGLDGDSVTAMETGDYSCVSWHLIGLTVIGMYLGAFERLLS